MREDDILPVEQISIVANGHPCLLSAGSTIANLLESLKVTATYVVVQMDGKIIPRSDYAMITLQPESKLEIITMVGGG